MKRIFLLITFILFGLTLTACKKDTFAGDINVYTRDAASGTREAFQTVVGFESNELVDKAIESNGNGDQATKVGNDEYGIGYVSLSTDMDTNNIKSLKYNDVEATEENVLNNTYQLQRPFKYVTREEFDFSNENVKNMTSAFIAYLGTKDGMSVLKQNHVIVDSTNAPTWNSIKDSYTITNNSNPITIRMGGSTSVENAIRAAANAFKALAPAFDYTMDQTGSSDGYKRTLGGEKDNKAIEIGFASRTFKDSENVSTAYLNGTFGIDAVAVVVEKNNPMSNITTDQLRGIYIGEISKWEDLVK